MKKVVQNSLSQKGQELLQIDENLYELLLEAKALFEAIDKYSAQVRALEKELQKINANFPFRLKIKEEQESLTQPVLKKHIEWSIDEAMLGYTCQNISYLVWETDEGTKNFRLFLVIEEKEFVLFDCTDSLGIKREFCCQVKSKRPLIETDIQTRLTYCGHLHQFVQSFKEHLRNYRITIEMGEFFANRSTSHDVKQSATPSSDATGEPVSDEPKIALTSTLTQDPQTP